MLMLYAFPISDVVDVLVLFAVVSEHDDWLISLPDELLSSLLFASI